VYYLLRYLRQPNPARIEWDESAITEWDGDRVRIAIPWSEARRSIFRGVVQYKSQAGRDLGSESYVVLQIRSPRGTITVASAGGKQGTFRHSWLRFRRCHAPSISDLLRDTASLPEGDPVAPDERGKKSYNRVVWKVVSLVAHLVAAGGLFLMAFPDHHHVGRDRDPSGSMLVLLAACLLIVRAIPLVVEWVSARGDSRARMGMVTELALRLAAVGVLVVPAIRVLLIVLANQARYH
jgi:hypothetical protein